MKQQKYLFRLLLIAAIGLPLVFSSCDKDDPDPVYAKPTVSVANDAEIMAKPGETITVPLTLSAEGGNGVLIVNRDGGFLEEVELDAQATTYDYTVTTPADAEEGDDIEYEFVLVNTQELESDPATFNIDIAVYEQTTVGSTAVYVIDIPETGVVPSGTTVKLAAGRDYMIGMNVTFEAGSQFIIEEGVTVYMSTAGEPIEVSAEGMVDIQGTATDPVVMTSDKVLMEGQQAEPGDWSQFQIEGEGLGSNSGTVRYLRLEYGEEDVFELDAVGSGTTIEYVQVYKSDDEAFFFGDEGDVNAKYLVATDAGDISYRIGDSYSGNLQFLISHNTIDAGEAIYIRENAAPVISNVTVVGPGVASGFENAGIRLRATTGTGKIYNAIVTALPDWGVRADDEIDAVPIPPPTTIDGNRVFAYSNVYDNDSRDDDDGAIFFSEASFMNSEEPIAGVAAGSFVPSAEATSDFDPSTLGEFFVSAAFKGAIQSAANDWTTGWVKNSDGSVR